MTREYTVGDIRKVQYIPGNMHTVFALLCFVVVIHWLIFPYPSGLLHWHCGNLTIAPVPAKQQAERHSEWPRPNGWCPFSCVPWTHESTQVPCCSWVLGQGSSWMAGGGGGGGGGGVGCAPEVPPEPKWRRLRRFILVYYDQLKNIQKYKEFHNKCKITNVYHIKISIWFSK